MIYGLDTEQLRVHVVGPTLSHLGLWSRAAENLVLGTAFAESGARYVKQVGGGPALGLWQMEPETHDDIWRNFLSFNASLRERVQELQMPAFSPEVELKGNLFYGAAMCRIHYYRVAAPLPRPHDAPAMAWYWKCHYNTMLGAGTFEKALPHFRAACGTPVGLQ